MKYIKWLGLLAATAVPLLGADTEVQTTSENAASAQTQSAAAANLSAPAAEVIRLAGGDREPIVAALLRQRPLALHRYGLVLALRLFLGLGSIPLWPLVAA